MEIRPLRLHSFPHCCLVCSLASPDSVTWANKRDGTDVQWIFAHAMTAVFSVCTYAYPKSEVTPAQARDNKGAKTIFSVLKVAQTKWVCPSELNWTRMPTTSALSLALLPPLFPPSSFPLSFTACAPPVPFHPPLFSRSASGPDPVGVLLGKHETVFANFVELGLHNHTKSEYYKHDTVHFLGSFTAL